MKTIWIASFLIFTYTNIRGQTDTLFIRQWDETQKTIKYIEGLTTVVKKQKYSFRRRVTKMKFFSSENKTIKHNVKIKYRNGNVIARHFYKLNYLCEIRVVTINDKPVLIKRKGEFNPLFSFTYLGNSKWNWIYSKETTMDPIYYQKIIDNWH
jgi:hypothetical protein